MILLDSSVLIEVFRKQNKHQTLFYRLCQKSNALAISTISYYEVGIGNRKLHQAYWEELCGYLIVLPFDIECSKIAIEIYLDLLKK